MSRPKLIGGRVITADEAIVSTSILKLSFYSVHNRHTTYNKLHSV